MDVGLACDEQGGFSSVDERIAPYPRPADQEKVKGPCLVYVV